MTCTGAAEKCHCGSTGTSFPARTNPATANGAPGQMPLPATQAEIATSGSSNCIPSPDCTTKRSGPDSSSHMNGLRSLPLNQLNRLNCDRSSGLSTPPMEARYSGEAYKPIWMSQRCLAIMLESLSAPPRIVQSMPSSSRLLIRSELLSRSWILG